mgnify:CR=1 FL=1
MSARRLSVVLLAVVAMAIPAMAAERQVVADFDMPPPSNLGGGYGAFSPNPEEMTYVTVETMDDTVRNGTNGASMKLEYNVDQAGSYNGFWMKLGPQEAGNNFDASAFTKLSFWVKGDSSVGIPSKVKIELKGDPGTRIGRSYVSGITDNWTRMEVPLSSVSAQRVDLTKLNEFVIVFENNVVAPGKKGVIWIDDIAFEP